MDTTEPTADERRLVESYQGVLTDVARCAQAIRDGDWAQVAVIAMDLSRSGVLLAVAAGELREPATTPRAEVVLDVLARHPGSPLARLLHPTQPVSVAKTVMSPVLALGAAQASTFYHQVAGATEAAMSDRLRGAERAGQITAGTPVTVLAQALAGAILYRLLVRQPVTAAFVDDLADVLLGDTG